MAGGDVLHLEHILKRRHSLRDHVICRKTRWNPPAIKWTLGLMAAAASTIFSIPGCEQPTTSTTPSDVLMASDNSLSSLVPGASDTTAMSVIPGATSVVLSMVSKLAPCQAVPNFMTSGGLPS